MSVTALIIKAISVRNIRIISIAMWLSSEDHSHNRNFIWGAN